MEKRKLGSIEVSALGLGCMGLSEFYAPTSEQSAIELIQTAFEVGITFFDTADMYGMGANEKLLGNAIKDFRDKIILATKVGIVRNRDNLLDMEICGKPDYVRKQCEESLKRLRIETIDLYYQHRVDPQVPIEETIGEMAKLVKEGKVRYLGLSEANASQIRRAHAVHPITALQSEYSLWTRDPEEEIFQTCKELNIGFVAFSPIGRGFLSGRFRNPEDIRDYRNRFPRFQKEHFKHNFEIVKVVEEMALRKRCTPSQLALAWVLAQSPSIIPIFGTSSFDHLLENCASLQIHLSEEELKKMDEKIPKGYAKGERYPPALHQATKK
jgi:aryl-alcohol dehydrogenase-like predicted oxidoreductase